jgi:hypothetical protein
VAHDTDRSIIVTASAEPELTPHKLPPHVVPGARD